MSESGEATSQPFEKRGVENPRVVDLITTDPQRGEVVLKILEGRGWGSSPQQMTQLEDKLNSYFSYILDGFLVRDYPQYARMPVAIRLECAQPPGPAEDEFLWAVTLFCTKHDLRFEVKAVEDPFAERAPWEAE